MDTIEQIVQEVMSGKIVRIVTESTNDDEIRGLMGNLRKMNSEVKTNCNQIILPKNLTRLTVDINLIVKKERTAQTLMDALRSTTLIIQRS